MQTDKKGRRKLARVEGKEKEETVWREKEEEQGSEREMINNNVKETRRKIERKCMVKEGRGRARKEGREGGRGKEESERQHYTH